MAFCKNCGSQIDDDSKFCSECGTMINGVKSNDSRKIVFDGEIHKCPHCGEVLSSFTTICKSCGTELRGQSTTASVSDFAFKLANSVSDKERINVISNYPVPNNKEDILEFMIIASSNFDATYYSSHLYDEDVSDAWYSKIKQCYDKAKILFQDSNDFDEIEIRYQQINERIEECIKEFRQTTEQENHKKARDEVKIVLAKVGKDFKNNIVSKMMLGLIAVAFLFGGISLVLGCVLSGSISLVFGIFVVVGYLIGINVIPVPNLSIRSIAIVSSFFLLIPTIIVCSLNFEFDMYKYGKYNDTYTWDGDGCKQYIPKPETVYGKILKSTDTKLSIELYQTSEDYYKKYVQACKDVGYCNNANENLYIYKATNKYSCEITIMYDNEKHITSVNLDTSNITIELGYSKNDLLSQDYISVVDLLKNNGFENVKMLEKKVAAGECVEYSVESVKIDGSTEFKKGDLISKKASIVVTYFRSNIVVGVDSSELKGMNYKEVIAIFESKGFTNIGTATINDLITGWLVKVGEVESVSIDGVTAFNANAQFEYDSRIIISYHTK